MKKKVYLLICLLLLSAGFPICSCNSDDPSDQPSSHQNETPVDSAIVNNDTTEIDSTEAYIVISAVPVSDEMKNFFDEALPKEDSDSTFLPGKPSNCSFVLNDNDIPELLSTCHIINSMEELERHYLGYKSLPQIDFSESTLIYGRLLIDHEEVLDSMNIRLYSNHKNYDNTKVLVFHTTDYSHTAAYEHIWGKFVRYWGFFPKLDEDQLKLEIVSTKLYR